jgi:hypothetical protein
VLVAAVAGGTSLPRALGWCALAGVVTAASFAAPALVGHHPIASMREALRIHREFFTEPRDYGAWLVFDPLDLAVFIGLPVAASLAAAGRSRRAPPRRRVRACRRTRPSAWELSATLFLLLMSGQTRGEVGRIWIPIMPVLLVAALARPARPDDDSAPNAASAVVLAAAVAPATIAIALWWRFF